FSKPVFPVDTIPCWASIYTGLNPANNGLLYVYDIFDPNLSDLKKLNIDLIKERAFWDYVGRGGYKTTILFPQLMYPPWKVNGLMISKSSFDVRLDWMKTESEVRFSPEDVQIEYDIPKKVKNLWGGFPGENSLYEWAELGKTILKQEEDLAMNIYLKSKWDMFFVYFNILDLIQHRTWRYFDINDPTYPGKTQLQKVILDYYILFDSIIGRFIDLNPDLSFLVLSDHGHKMRPIKTININEYLRKLGYLVIKGRNKRFLNNIRKLSLKILNKLNIEHMAIKIVTMSPKITQLSKSAYSSSGYVNADQSIASLSHFAGIKSYSYGGLEINRELISDQEYDKIRHEIIEELIKLNETSEEPLIRCVKKREDVYEGIYNEMIFPDIVFDFEQGYCVGWDLFTDLLGKSYDHNVASGGHANRAVLLTKNINRDILDRDISLIDIAPSILDYYDIDSRKIEFDGKTIFK
ncbi:MAG: alkaline phosphatase family protein, partial [Methanobacterium sp.]